MAAFFRYNPITHHIKYRKKSLVFFCFFYILLYTQQLSGYCCDGNGHDSAQYHTGKENAMSSVSNSTQKPEEEREEDILQNTSRPAEEKHLSQILDVIRNNLDNYGSQVSKMRKDINEMLEHYHDDNPELNLLLNNTITLHDHMKRALERNEKALNKPYFGRIIFQDETIGKEESLYIGRGGISSDSTHQAVVDWRAPVANAYYENGLGKCSYTAPGGKQIDIDLKLKRTYEIEGGKLKDYFDSEVIANDELLTKYGQKQTGSAGRNRGHHSERAERDHPQVSLSQYDRPGRGRLR